MQCDGKTITFARNLWVQHGGVQVRQRGDQVAVTLRDDDAFLKIFNHFGRVLKLFVAEAGAWVDTDTGQAPGVVDLSQAGYVTPGAAGQAAESIAGGAASAGAGDAPARAARGKAATRSARGKAAKPAVAGRPAAKKRPGKSGRGAASAKAATAPRKRRGGESGP